MTAATEVLKLAGKALPDVAPAAEQMLAEVVETTLENAPKIIRSRLNYATILDAGKSDIYTLEQTAAKKSAFGVLQDGDDLVAARIPIGGFNTFKPIDGGIAKQVEPGVWQSHTGNTFEGDIQLVKGEAGSELHVSPKGADFESIHFTDGNHALKHTPTGASIESNGAWSHIEKVTDANGTTYSARYNLSGELDSLQRFSRNSAPEQLPVISDYNRNAGGFYLTRHGLIKEVTPKVGDQPTTTLYHAIDGKTYPNATEAVSANNKLFGKDPIADAMEENPFTISSNFPPGPKKSIYVKHGRTGTLVPRY